MVDFNKILENSNRMDMFEKNKKQIEASMKFDLTGKSNADYSRGSYSEIPLTNSNATSSNGIDFGDLLSITELKENEMFEKLVYLKDYSTQVNKFDRFKSDLIVDFVDRDGVEIRSRAFGRLDTSNQITLLEKVKTLKGNVIYLQGRMISRSGRYFIDIIHLQESTVNQEVAKEFFKKEVIGRKEIVQKVWTEIAKYPLANSLYSNYELLISTSAINNVYERQGGYIYYLNLLISSIQSSPIDIKYKDRMLTLDLIKQLKQFVNNVELAKTIQYNAVSKYGDKEAEELLNEGLFNSVQDRSVYEEILDGYRKGIISMILLEDWSKWGLETVYSNFHKSVLRINGGK